MSSKALLIGLNYTHSQKEVELTGCVRDARNMEEFLKDLDFENIKVLTDEDPRDLDKLTWSGIVMAIHRLCVESWEKNLATVFFHYSGHGRQVRETLGHEKDGLNEGIVPIDYNVHGTITDDVLNTLFTTFNPSTRIVCVFDCCHSSTILDLPFNWTNGVLNSDSQDSKASNRNGPDIVCLSACQDSQIAGEFHISLDTGAFTTCLLEQLHRHPKANIHKVHSCVNDMLTKNGYKQICALSSSFTIPKDYCLIDALSKN
jgi:metacaspase-1